ncbi:MAG: gliding motility-associated C-terminal domain-containing protein, partial [Bacteroidales bacterium]|nr:gliding motility-associated C-terminal domain-containing protein [Bacteroidales bacterium]
TFLPRIDDSRNGGIPFCTNGRDTSITVYVEPTPRFSLTTEDTSLCNEEVIRLYAESLTQPSSDSLHWSYNLTITHSDIEIISGPAADTLALGDFSDVQFRNNGNTARLVTCEFIPYIFYPGTQTLSCEGIPVNIEIWIEPTPEVVLERLNLDLGANDTVFCSGLATRVKITSNTQTSANNDVRFRYTIEAPSEISFSYPADTFDLEKDDEIIVNITNNSTEVQEILIIAEPYIINGSGDIKCDGYAGKRDTIRYDITPLIIMLDSARTYVYDTLHIRCHGDNSGVIYMFSEGGIEAYDDYTFDDLDYYFQNGYIDQSEDSIAGLTEGTYALRAEDFSGCISYDTLVLNEPQALQTSFTIAVAPVCEGDTGKFTANYRGGTWFGSGENRWGYTLYWTLTGDYEFPGDSLIADTIFEATNGDFRWTVVDTNGCIIHGDSTYQGSLRYIDTFEPVDDYIGGQYDGFDLTCYRRRDGELFTSMSDNLTTYDFYLIDSASATIVDSVINGTYRPKFDSLPAGTYYLNVYTQEGCFLKDSTSLDEPDSLHIVDAYSVFINEPYHVQCSGYSNGRINVDSVTGGRPDNYIYVWMDEGDILQEGETEYIQNLPAGDYSVIVHDNYCYDSMDFELVEPPPIDPNAAITQVVCNGEETGMISLDPIGEPEFLYQWSDDPSRTDSIAEDLSPGEYSFTITDGFGCTVEDTIQITEPPAITFSAEVSDYNGWQVACHGDSSGWININAEGGTGELSYQWHYNYAPYDAITDSISGLREGNYSVLISDENECFELYSRRLDAPRRIQVDFSVANQVCNTYGTIVAIPDGGVPFESNPEYLYTWRDESDQIIGNSHTINELDSGWYFVQLTDMNECTLIDSAHVINEDPLEVELEVLQEIDCFGAETGSLRVNYQNETEPITILWNGLEGGEILESIPAGEYLVEITDNNGCYDSASYILDQPPDIFTDIYVQDANCYGSSDAWVELGAVGGVGDYSYRWDGNIIQGTFVQYIRAGQYMLRITDGNQCVLDTIVIIKQPDQIIIEASEEDIVQPVCEFSSNGSITVSVTGGIEPYSYSWISYGDTIGRDYTINGLNEGEYIIQVEDNHSCFMTRSFTLESLLPACVVIPSAFSPNGDPWGQSWVLELPEEIGGGTDISEHYPDLTVVIFDRTGRKVWTSEKGYPAESAWQGTDNQGRLLPVDTYYYIICISNTPITNGIVTVIR